MGALASQQCIAKKINMTELVLTKKSQLGRHFRNKTSNQQILLLQVSTDVQTDTPMSIINEHLKSRIKINNKNIPQIIEFKDHSTSLCNLLPGFSLWMKHPLRSLQQQIQQRLELNQNFSEGQIWMIAYSTLSALAGYQTLNFNFSLAADKIYISQNGEVILSDAHLYKSGKLLLQKNKKKDPFENILILVNILQKLMTKINLRHFENYSQQLYELLNKIRSQKSQSYRKVTSQIIFYKTQLQNSKLKPNKNQKVCDISLAESQLIQIKQNTPICDQNIQNILSDISNLHNQPNKNNLQRGSSLNIRCQNKFIRTAPIIRDHNQLKIQKLNLTTIVNSTKNYSSDMDISSISAGSKKTINQKSNKQNSIQLMQNILIQSTNYKPSHVKTLSQKNKQFLQNLILKQKNMIVQVPESDYDLQSMRSKISPSQNISLISAHTVNTYPESQSMGQIS